VRLSSEWPLDFYMNAGKCEAKCRAEKVESGGWKVVRRGSNLMSGPRIFAQIKCN